MPDLNFKVTGVEPAARGLVPLLHFHPAGGVQKGFFRPI